MDVESLLNLPKPVSELTDEELITHLTPFFGATRPKKPISPVMKRASGVLNDALGNTSAALTSAAKSQAEKLAAAYKAAGIDPVTKLPIKAQKTGLTLKDLRK